MNDKYLNDIININKIFAKKFMINTTDDISMQEKRNVVIRETRWLDFIEDTIPYIDAIVRNPRNFIIQEEEMIPIEKVRNISKDSLRHLAKHTSLIQDIDEDGMVQPLKLLNVYREETFEVYENRFIYSLLVNTRAFLEEQLSKEGCTFPNSKVNVINYKSNTTLDEEEVKVNLEIIRKQNISDSSLELKKNAAERIEKVLEIFNYFLSSASMKSLVHCQPVRSPIRKTNAILKDKNFIKAAELWEFLERFDKSKAIVKKQVTKNIEIGNVDEKLKYNSLVDYMAITDHDLSYKDKSVEYIDDYLKIYIETMLINGKYSEEKLIKYVSSEVKRIKSEEVKKISDIMNVINISIADYKSNYKKAMKLL